MGTIEISNPQYGIYRRAVTKLILSEPHNAPLICTSAEILFMDRLISYHGSNTHFLFQILLTFLTLIIMTRKCMYDNIRCM